jgi:glutathione peroxidase
MRISNHQAGVFATGRRPVLRSALALVGLRTGGALLAASTALAARAQSGQRAGAPAACPALLNHVFARLQDDSPLSLCDFAGKVVLVVNTASQCGFTPQYEGLERLHGRFAARGLVILGFPSNDFGQQEPGNSRQIGEVCFNTYGVRFPMLAKSVVTGALANPLHAELARLTGQPPRWNFHKYLIDRTGQAVAQFPSRVAPESREMVAAIEKALAAA